MSDRARLASIVASAALALAPFPARAQGVEPERLASEAAAVVPVDVETRLVVSMIAGEVVLQAGKPGELRFHSRKKGTAKEELPVELWLDRGRFVIKPPAESAGQARTIQIIVPPSMSARVEAPPGSSVIASGLRAGLEVVGASLNVDARGMQGAIDLEVDGLNLIVQTTAGDVRLRGKLASAAIEGVAGSIFAEVTGNGMMKLRQVRDFDGDLEGTLLVAEKVDGPFHLKARGGTANVSGLAQGGTFDLAGTVLAIEKSKGEMTITTDADVRFSETEASLHFDLYGASLIGSGNKGILEARTRNATINVEKVEQSVRIQGDGLDLSLVNVGGETLVYARSSKVKLDNIGGPLIVENDGGDVTATRVTKDTTVKCEGCSVRLGDLAGSASVEADGEIVDVGWASLPGDKDSHIKNAGGDVVVRFPSAGAACRIDARASYGVVESEWPRVIVQDDGKSAVGAIGNASRPWVRIEAEGNIRIVGGSSAPPPAAGSEE